MERIKYIKDLPQLAHDEIHVWGVHLPEIKDQLAALRNMLCPQEKEKADRFRRESDRNSSIAARGALRILLSGYTHLSASEIQFHYSENGKPYLLDSDIGFNVSHSAEWVVLAMGRNRKVGVDVEQIRRGMDVNSIAARFFTPMEIEWVENAPDRHAAFFQLWASKEAYVKACGSTLFAELSSFSVPTEERGEKEGWIFRQLEAGSKYAAALVTDRALARVTCYDFGGLKWDS